MLNILLENHIWWRRRAHIKWSTCKPAWIGATRLKPAAFSASRKLKKYVFSLKSDTVDPMEKKEIQKTKPLVQDFAVKWIWLKLLIKITIVGFCRKKTNSNVHSINKFLCTFLVTFWSKYQDLEVHLDWMTDLKRRFPHRVKVMKRVYYSC